MAFKILTYLLVLTWLSSAGPAGVAQCKESFGVSKLRGHLLSKQSSEGGKTMITIAAAVDEPAYSPSQPTLSSSERRQLLGAQEQGAPSSIRIAVMLEGNPQAPDFLNAMQMAADELNRNPSRLFQGAHLDLRPMYPQRDQYEVAMSMVEILEELIVVVIGPLYSFSARIASPISSAAHIPLVSWSATDPSLSDTSLHPYFVRTVQSDSLLMQGLADLVTFFKWKQLVSVHVNDDYGLGGVQALENHLRGTNVQIVERIALSIDSTVNNIESILQQVRSRTEATVFVVHLLPQIVGPFFDAVHSAGMVKPGFAWLLSHTTLETLISINKKRPIETQLPVEGMIGMRVTTPKTERLREFHDEWSRMFPDLREPDYFTTLAYDTVGLVGNAMALGLSQGNLSLSMLTVEGEQWGDPWDTVNANSTAVGALSSARNPLQNATIRRAGPTLLKLIHQVGNNKSLEWAAGPLELDGNSNAHATYDIVNLTPGQVIVGSWTNDQGLTLSKEYNDPAQRKASTRDFPKIVWPGFKDYTPLGPLGWLPKGGQKINVAVPINGRKPFVVLKGSPDRNDAFSGMVPEIFRAVMLLLPYELEYTFHPVNFTTYNEVCYAVSNGTFDIAVGDFSVTEGRSKIVAFTQQFIQASLVLIAPMKKASSFRRSILWPFMPFSWEVWLLLTLTYVVVVFTFYSVERPATRAVGPRQPGVVERGLLYTFWDMYTSLFFAHRGPVETRVGGIIQAFWLFFVVIVLTSYTAQLTSIFTAEALETTINNIYDVINSNHLKVGVPGLSWYREGLVKLGIPNNRIIDLTYDKYEEALKSGRVAAVVEESPYAEAFLKTRCVYRIAGKEFYKGGWGWPVSKNSRLQETLSTAILTLTTDAEVTKIERNWTNSATSCSDTQAGKNQLDLGLFLPPSFLVMGVAIVIAVCTTGIRASHGLSHAANAAAQVQLAPVDEGQVATKRASTPPLPPQPGKKLARRHTWDNPRQ